MSKHRHYSIDDPPYFCEQCGKDWASVVDGRQGRALRRQGLGPRASSRRALGLAWVAKFAVTVYHGCDRHQGEWVDCDYGPCGEMKRLGLTDTLVAARPVR